ncbi:MAG: hypothetical protein HZA48_06135 [Planctomycetes bacterium]|nr:hypothetical protein [Planctomycetota bacterium]
MKILDTVSDIVKLFFGFLYKHAVPILAVGTFAMLMLLVHKKAYDYLISTEEFNINLGTMKLSVQPDWASAWYNSTIELPPPSEEEICIFNKDIVETVAKHYEANPWVEKVDCVEKVFPDKLRVRLTLRKPVAVVEKSGWYYLVDAEETRLPGQYAQEETFQIGLSAIVRVNEPLPEPGQKWTGDGVKSGIAVLQALKDNGFNEMLKIYAVDVENIGGKMNPLQSEIVVWADNMVPVMWGKSPYSTKFGELSVDKKLENLKAVLSARPRLEGLRCVKIQFERPYVTLK